MISTKHELKPCHCLIAQGNGSRTHYPLLGDVCKIQAINKILNDLSDHD